MAGVKVAGHGLKTAESNRGEVEPMSETESLAVHEAAHAIAAHFLGLKLGREAITIVPDEKRFTLGVTQIVIGLGQDPEIDRITPKTHVRMEQFAIACLAGDIAERKYEPSRKWGADGDYEQAHECLSFISPAPAILEARLNVVDVIAKHLVDTRWPFIEAVAATLNHRKRLARSGVKQVINRVLLAEHAKRAGIPGK